MVGQFAPSEPMMALPNGQEMGELKIGITPREQVMPLGSFAWTEKGILQLSP